MKRTIIGVLIVVAVIGLAGPFLPLDFLRPRMERALQRGLGRRVEVGQVHFTLFSTPGLTLDDVTIHEDPSAGIEPFAYMQSLEAHPRLLGLLRGRLELSSLNLGDATVNLVKTNAGPWNFQSLLESGPAGLAATPAIRMRGGRVNFKFGDTKSVFYFSDADLDVDPYGNGAVALRFGGAPSRSDRSAQDFGHFFVRGRSLIEGGEQKLDLKVELEPSALEEIARLMDRPDFGVRGKVSLDAQLSGTPSHLEVGGQIQVDDLHRSDLPLQRGGGWGVNYKGNLDLRGERLELVSMPEGPNSPVTLRLRAWDFLKTPHWDASASVEKLPLPWMLDMARRMGASLPENAEGAISAAAHYSDDDGLTGRVEIQDAAITLPDAQTLGADSLTMVIDRQTVSFDTATIHLGEKQASFEGTYRLAPPGDLDLKMSTQNLAVADLRSLGLAGIPLLDRIPKGTWRGSARYHAAAGEKGNWAGDYSLENATISVDGLSDPVKLRSASVSVKGTTVAVSRISAEIGDIEFTGDYRWEPDAMRQHKFHIVMPEADAAELERLLLPTLMRDRGFLARALRFGSIPLPDWLQDRRGDGTIQVQSLTIGDVKLRAAEARLLWDSASVRLADLKAHVDQMAIAGDLEVDLAGRSPHYRFDGKLQEVAYKGGKMDFEGSVEADGAGVALLKSIQGAGNLYGRSIAFAPEVDFRSVSGCFEIFGSAIGPRWRLFDIDVTQGQDSYLGQGTAQSDGRVMLDLSNRNRQVRYTGSLFAMAPQP